MHTPSGRSYISPSVTSPYFRFRFVAVERWVGNINRNGIVSSFDVNATTIPCPSRPVLPSLPRKSDKIVGLGSQRTDTKSLSAFILVCFVMVPIMSRSVKPYSLRLMICVSCSQSASVSSKCALRPNVGVVRAGRTELAYLPGVWASHSSSFVSVCQSSPVPRVLADQKSVAELSIAVDFKVASGPSSG